MYVCVCVCVCVCLCVCVCVCKHKAHGTATCQKEAVGVYSFYAAVTLLLHCCSVAVVSL
jgi:hypothetical protein